MDLKQHRIWPFILQLKGLSGKVDKSPRQGMAGAILKPLEAIWGPVVISEWDDETVAAVYPICYKSSGVLSMQRRQEMRCRLAHEEEGQTLVEYGLLVSLLGIVSLAILLIMGGKVRDVFVQVNTRITSTS